jgi:hypothetical protein
MTMRSLHVLACSGILFAISVVTGHAQAPSPPTGLNPQVTGNFVQVSWNASPGAVSYILQAGTAPGASNLFNGVVGNITGASGTLPNGTYYWRVIAVGPSGAASPPSAESQFTVGGDTGCVPPGPPQGFSVSVTGLLVTVRWSPGSGGPPTTYILQAGSSSGQADLASLPTGNTATELSVQAPPGRYFARVLSQNACGTSGPSNEQIINVPGGTGEPGPTVPGCSYAVSPATVNVPISGGTIQVNVTAPGGCRWQLQSDPFITPTSNTGSGSTTVQYSVAAAGAPRTGQIVLSGLDPGQVTASQVVVQQAATAPGSCAVSLTPTSQNVNAAGGQFQFRVTANPGCTWSVAPTGGFISIVSAGLQAGSDSVIYSVATNPAAGARAGTIRITSSAGAQDHAITQQGVGSLTASFVMKEGSAVVTSCQINQGGGCSLDASASTPAGQITSYEWRTLRGGTTEAFYSGVSPSLNLGCNTQTPNNSLETFEVTLTITNTVGQTATLTRMLQLHRAGCGT